MLLTIRREQERVVLDVPPSDTPTHIEVLVVETRAAKVRLGIEAPPTVRINKGEPCTTPTNSGS